MREPRNADLVRRFLAGSRLVGSLFAAAMMTSTLSCSGGRNSAPSCGLSDSARSAALEAVDVWVGEIGRHSAARAVDGGSPDEEASVDAFVSLDGSCASEVMIINSGPVKGRLRLSILSDTDQLSAALRTDPLVSLKTQSLGTVDTVPGFVSLPPHESDLGMTCVLVAAQPCEYYGVTWVRAGCTVRVVEVDIYAGSAEQAGEVIEKALAASPSLPSGVC